MYNIIMIIIIVTIIITITITVVAAVVVAFQKPMLLSALLSKHLLANVSVYTIEAATHVQNAEAKAYASTTN